MQAGKLRNRLEFCRVVENQDSTGDPVEQLEPLVTLWGSVEPLRGREYFEAQQIQAELTHKLLVRFHPVLRDEPATPKLAVKFGQRLFDVVSVANITARDREIEIMAIERSANNAAGIRP